MSPTDAPAPSTPSTASAHRAGPLSGLTVLDVATLFAGPLAATMLADFGADVIKIEHPTKGDPVRSHGPSKDGVPLWWTMLARNKRTITLNLGDAAGAEVMKRLVADRRRADRELPARHAGALGAGPRGAARHQPRPGDRPGHRLRPVRPVLRPPGFGTLAESMSGFAAITGDPDGPPTLPPFGLADGITALTTSQAILTALYHRDVHGGPRPGDRRGDHRADRHHPGPAADRVRPARHRAAAHRQPLGQQRPAQHLPHPRRQVGRDLDERPVDRRARHAPRRPPRGHRRAVVRRRLRPAPSTPTSSTRTSAAGSPSATRPT